MVFSLGVIAKIGNPQAAGFFFGGHCEDWKPYSTRTRYSKELDYLLIYNLYNYIYMYIDRAKHVNMELGTMMGLWVCLKIVYPKN